ncbi:hypothetical protein BGW39_010236 [Mortierella sp. 14UC]|nr:hypothetical protein BGW39_010236 [Mortierella sp. 14UC]
MPPTGKRDKQWQFVRKEVNSVDELTLDYIRPVYGLRPCNETKDNDPSLAKKETGDRTESVYPYCGNRYKDSSSVTPSSLTKSKIVNPCTAARCKDGNPHCLNHMGQDQWEREDAFDKYFTVFGKRTDPEVFRRKPDSPAGMKNLGATCYANSLLQVWFHDLSFRDVIYRSRFRTEADKSLDPLHQLQYLFAHLDRGIKDVYNPLSLVTSLKLDTNMQQDAQEFCNLFMARIDNQLQSQEDVFLRNFVKNQFQGHYSYITTCKKCKKSSVKDCTFYELMLNIKENCTLMDCIDEFVEAEDLIGSDRYSCSHCQSLQDATRTIKVGKLPKVLNVQLMRFVYDTTTWTKKKSKDMIRFPETIDFGGLLGSQLAVLYDLSAVLVHSGPSAHSGHFMAHVLDKTSNKWFVLNDEEVTEFDSTQFDPQDYTESGSKVKAKAKKMTMKAGAPDAERMWNTLSSRSAYMLTYTRRTSEPLVTPRSPPSETLDLVTVDNASFDEELKEFLDFKEEIKSKFDQARELRRKLARCWDVNNDEDESCYVSAAALSKYMRLDGDQTTTNGSKPEESSVVDLDSSAVACEHRKLCPAAVSKSKRISMAAQQLLTEQGVKIDPVLTPMDVCEKCARNIFQDKLYSLMHKEDVDEFERLSKRKIGPPAVWISKSWLTAWKKMNPDFHRPHTSTSEDPGPLLKPYLDDVRCQHSGLAEDKSLRKVISQSCLKKLITIFGPMDLPGYDSSECQECQKLRQPPKEAITLIAVAASEKKELSGMKTRCSPNRILPEHQYYAVSGEFMEKWQSFVKDPANNKRPEMIDNSHLLCKHDLFRFDFDNPVDLNNDDDIALFEEKDWSYLRAAYDVVPEIVITKQALMETEESSDQRDEVFTVQSTPALCSECRNERILNFAFTTLTVRVYEPGEVAVDEKASASPASTDVAQDSASNKGSPTSNITNSAKSKRKLAPATSATGTRQSKRLKESKNPYKEIRIQNISKEDTVMDLKLKIMKKTDIVPLYQKLLYGQVELEENRRTVADLAIPPGAVLNLLTFDQGMDDLDLETFHDETPAPGDVGGFGGTGLTDNWF